MEKFADGLSLRRGRPVDNRIGKAHLRDRNARENGKAGARRVAGFKPLGHQRRQQAKQKAGGNCSHDHK